MTTKPNPKVCNHCKGDLTSRNPEGFCDHLYYPEYCDVCANPKESLSDVDTAESSVRVEELREKIARIQHSQWSGWMEYLFSKSMNNGNSDTVIPFELSQRWVRQINTPYDELPDNEKESDRIEADKILDLVSQAVADAREEEMKAIYNYICDLEPNLKHADVKWEIGWEDACLKILEHLDSLTVQDTHSLRSVREPATQAGEEDKK